MLRKFNLLILLAFATSIVSCSKDDNNGTKSVLKLSANEMSFMAESASKEVTVESTAAWTVTPDTASWVTLTSEGTAGNGKFTVQVTENTGENSRTATITVTSGELSQVVKVSQVSYNDPSYDTMDSIKPNHVGIRDITSFELSKEMVPGWNLGNSLEAIGGETKWGNPLVTQRLIDSIKAAGFKSVRIPVAWSQFSDETSFTIKTEWMDRVEEVVNYVLGIGLYAVVNMHWDGGWMQPTYAKQQYVNDRMSAMWKQIAVRFRNYDDHLIFAGTNEVMVEGNYNAPSKEYAAVQNGFNQVFVSTVRATGGKNTYRYLAVQGFNTNIDYTISSFIMPTDIANDKRLLVEVHYYDPYNFTINEKSAISQWGKNATDASKTETWANETYVDKQFGKMKTNFVDKGYGVLVGEYGTIAKLSLEDNAKFRVDYTLYVTQSMVKNSLVPMYWDNGATGNNGMGLFNRNTGEKAYPQLVKAIMDACAGK